MSTAAPAKLPDLSPERHPFPVMKRGQIVGQFSNLLLALLTAREKRGCKVLEYQTPGGWIEFREE